MPEVAVNDDLFAEHLNRLGVATVDQIDEARRLQSASRADGTAISLPDALIKRGVITQTTKENIVKQIEARQQGGLRQLGPYKLVRKIGQGSMGAVFLAKDTRRKRRVAIKVLPKKLSTDKTYIARFRREAKVAGTLSHPNIVRAHEVGEELGFHYYAMEYCEGETLDRVLKRDGALPWQSALV